MTNKKITKRSKWLKLALISTASLTTLATIPAAICAKVAKTSTPTANTELTASYVRLSFALRDADKEADPAPTLTGETSVRIKKGGFFGTANKPKAEWTGRKFLGWTAPDSTTILGDEKVIDDNMTVYALFEHSSSISINTKKTKVSLGEQNLKCEATVHPKEAKLNVYWYATDSLTLSGDAEPSSTHISIDKSTGKFTTKTITTKDSKAYIFAVTSDSKLPSSISAGDSNVLTIEVVNPTEDPDYADKVITEFVDEGNIKHTIAVEPSNFSNEATNLDGKELGTNAVYSSTKASFNKPIAFGKNVSTIGDDFMNAKFDEDGNPVSGFTSFNQKIEFNNVVYIGDNFLKGNLYYNCTDGITLPKTLKYIGDGFLSDCLGFNQEITFTEGCKITHIGEDFMDGCQSYAKEFIVPQSLTYIGGSFMYNCKAQTTITIRCNVGVFQPSDASFSADYEESTPHEITVTCEEDADFDSLHNQFEDLPREGETTKILSRQLVSGDIPWENHLACIKDDDGYHFIDDLETSGLCKDDNTTPITTPDGQSYPREEFNHELYLNPNLASLTAIPNHFLFDCKAFDREVIIPSTVKSIGSHFMAVCHAFKHSLIIPSSITNENSIGEYFMYNCKSFAFSANAQLIINCAHTCFIEDDHTCATNDSNAACYTSGIWVAGTHASDFAGRFLNSDSSPWRKIRLS